MTVPSDPDPKLPIEPASGPPYADSATSREACNLAPAQKLDGFLILTLPIGPIGVCVAVKRWGIGAAVAVRRRAR